MSIKKAVMLLSGGLDSTTLAYDLVSQGYNVFPISFFYGQKHSKELDAASATSKRLGLLHKILDLRCLGEVAPSALTRDSIIIPSGSYQDESMKITVVPNRNMVFLSLAISYAIGIEAGSVWYGAHSGDHTIYADCRPSFVKAMSKAVKLCDLSNIKLRAPYLYLNKSNIVERGTKLGVDYSLTWTCYEGREKACGLCGSCIERREAFGMLGLIDPIEYEQ